MWAPDILQLEGFNALADNVDFSKSDVAAEFLKAPLGFIDIGARGGVHDIVAPIAKLTDVLCFEPDAEGCAELEAEFAKGSPWARIQALPVGLADFEGEATLHLMAAPTNHSLLPGNKELAERYNIVTMADRGTAQVPVTTLDKVLSAPNANRGEFIKIDVQGGEPAVMNGALKTLQSNTVAVITEVCFWEQYEGQKLFAELELFLREQGFAFYGFYSQHRRSQKQLDKKIHRGAERIVWADAVFFKDPLKGSPFKGSLTDRQHKALFLSAMALSYYDFALELAHSTFGASKKDFWRQVVFDIASFPPSNAVSAVEALAAKIKQSPDRANIEVGRFVDTRRQLFDYDDVYKVAP